jgi:hypothetical protein
VKNINASNNAIEADYAWSTFRSLLLHFKTRHLGGMFNNYMTPEFKMDYNPKKRIYEKSNLSNRASLIMNNIADAKGKIDNENAIDGNFYQTENEYTILVYYKKASTDTNA